MNNFYRIFVLTFILVFLAVFAGCGDAVGEEPVYSSGTSATEVTFAPSATVEPDATDYVEETEIPRTTAELPDETPCPTECPETEKPLISPCVTDTLMPTDASTEVPTPSATLLPTPEPSQTPCETSTPDQTDISEPEPTVYVTYEDGKGEVIHFPPAPLH